nr:isoprenylcysteine carboxylmethyltransferase family protein [Streptococcus suis]
MATLYYLRRILGDKWTVGQLFGETYHPIYQWLFQTVRHPNIFLIIIPELVGLALLCHAKYSLIFLFPIYMGILHGRIREENLLEKETVVSNSRIDFGRKIAENN